MRSSAVFAAAAACARLCARRSAARLRKHVCIFADGARLAARRRAGASDRPGCEALRHAGVVGRVNRSEHERSHAGGDAQRTAHARAQERRLGRRARPIFPACAVTSALRDPRDGALYAALKHGHFGAKLHRSDDGGTIVEGIGRAGVSGRCRGRAVAVSDLDDRGRAAPTQPGRLWVGRHSGRAVPLRRSRRDLGARQRRCGTCRSARNGSAAAMTMPASIRSRPIRAIRAACSSRSPAAACGNSRDDGAKLDAARQGPGRRPTCRRSRPAQLEMQDPHRVARCAAAPDVMWMQHHNGIFRSTDAGATWTQLKPPGDDFGFAVAAHPKDAQDRLVRARRSRTSCACRATARSA